MNDSCRFALTQKETSLNEHKYSKVLNSHSKPPAKQNASTLPDKSITFLLSKDFYRGFFCFLLIVCTVKRDRKQVRESRGVTCSKGPLRLGIEQPQATSRLSEKKMFCISVVLKVVCLGGGVPVSPSKSS